MYTQQIATPSGSSFKHRHRTPERSKQTPADSLVLFYLTKFSGEGPMQCLACQNYLCKLSQQETDSMMRPCSEQLAITAQSMAHLVANHRVQIPGGTLAKERERSWIFSHVSVGQSSRSGTQPGSAQIQHVLGILRTCDACTKCKNMPHSRC